MDQILPVSWLLSMFPLENTRYVYPLCTAVGARPQEHHTNTRIDMDQRPPPLLCVDQTSEGVNVFEHNDFSEIKGGNIAASIYSTSE